MVLKLYRDTYTYPQNAGTSLIISDFSDEVKYGVNAMPVGGTETPDDYDSGAFIMSLGGRTIKYTFVLDVVTDQDLYEEYKDFRNFFATYTIGSYILIQCDELGWTYDPDNGVDNRKKAVVESHRTRISAGTKNYMRITLSVYVGDIV